ncbi:potassium channel family protein, partial [Micromonospora sp. WP24]|uniref:potassium channel family protein n=1 Tax=Micromonospora sp. WP24 TaxID=2604469 RepID=UPI0021060350
GRHPALFVGSVSPEPAGGRGGTVDNPHMTGDRPFQRERRRALLGCALLVVAYFVVPLDVDGNGAWTVVRAVTTALAVIAAVTLAYRQVRRQLTGPPSGHREARALLRLAVTLVAGLLAFALADLVVARTWPGEFEGIQTRIDALYFALATLTTIGYGDVSAQGQIARAFVCAQMVFSVGVLASGVSVLIRQVLRPKG